jgi:cellulase
MFSKAIIAGALLGAASAHQNFHQFWVNDQTPGYQVGIRMPPSNSPVTDVKSDDMACNVGGSKVPSGVKTVAAAEGDSIKVQWDNSGHPGPITHFLYGPVDDAAQATGVGAGWFKIDEQDQVGGKWASEVMQANNMTHEFKLPTGLASGEYLLRSEMLALHSSQTVDGAQFYIGCAQLKITGTGSKGACSPTISLPGAYKADDADIYIPNYYNGFDASSYAAPGGPVATCGGSGNTAPAPATSAASNGTAVPTSAVATSAAASAPAATSAAATSVVAETPVASATASAPASSGSALPKEFTLETFIAWLKEQAA